MKAQFENTLHYSSPAHGDWGVVRIGMLIPESYQLFICPFACGRHGAIGARAQGLHNRLSYLYINQSDIIDGYDDLIVKAVKDLFVSISEVPKVLLVVVSCLDDLIGTDHEALLQTLAEQYPAVRFRIGHMNPISLDSKTPPGVSIQNNIYSLLEDKKPSDKGINSIGNLVNISPDCELYDVLKAYGIGSLRHVSDYKKLEDMQEMTASSLNLVISPTAKQSAADLEKRFQIPSLFMPITYDLDEIEANYKKLLQAIPCDGDFDFSKERIKAEKAIKEAVKTVGDLPIIIDNSAVMQPFGLAQTLLTYGFNVVRVEAQNCLPFDQKHFEWVTTNYPAVEIHQPQHFDSVRFDRTIENSLAIGVDGAYLSKSRYVTDLFADEGMFGYHGVFSLMQLLINTIENPQELEQIINGYGLVV